MFVFGDYFKGETLLRLISSKDEGVEKIIPYNGKEFELVSCKELKKEKAFHGFSTNVEIEYLYVLAGENGMKKNVSMSLVNCSVLVHLAAKKLLQGWVIYKVKPKWWSTLIIPTLRS